MSDLFNPSDVLLSAAQIAAARKEYDEWGAKIAHLELQREARREWFSLVAKLIGEERSRELIGDIATTVSPASKAAAIRRQRSGKVTWTGFIEDFVRSVDRPVDYSEIREAVSKSVLAENNLEYSDKSFYGAILKLSGKGAIVKEAGWVFSPEAYRDYHDKLSKGEIDELPESSSQQHARGSRIGDEILRFLKSKPHGATGREIIDHIVQIEEFRKPVERNNTSVYNVLSRFVKREALRKIGGTYFHPPTDEIENSGPDEETAV